MTSHVQSCSLLEYCVSILFAENKVLRQVLTKRVFLFTLHIKNTLWLDKTWDFRESLCRIFGQAQTPQLSQPFQSHFLAYTIAIALTTLTLTSWSSTSRSWALVWNRPSKDLPSVSEAWRNTNCLKVESFLWDNYSAFIILLPVVEMFEKLHPDIGLVGIGRNCSKEWNMYILKSTHESKVWIIGTSLINKNWHDQKKTIKNLVLIFAYASNVHILPIV